MQINVSEWNFQEKGLITSQVVTKSLCTDDARLEREREKFGWDLTPKFLKPKISWGTEGCGCCWLESDSMIWPSHWSWVADGR